MNCNEQCFGCHGLYDVDDDIASSSRLTLNTLSEDLDVEESDISTIRDFGSEPPFRSSVCDVMLWILCFDLG